METDYNDIRLQTEDALKELLSVASPLPGQILIVGCSTSEVRGERIGSAGSEGVAKAILDGLQKECRDRGIFLAIQCCEHLNRALVVDREAVEKYRLEPVSVVPVRTAGGALATAAMNLFKDPVVVEEIQAHMGLDIGLTLIGMHLKKVAVPVRLQQKKIGYARIAAAYTRPKLIGGSRAVYEAPARS